MPDNARLVAIEGNQDRNEVHRRFSRIDLRMLAVSEGGRERSAAEMQRLLTNEGMHTLATLRTVTDLLLVEAAIPDAVHVLD